MSTGIVFDIKRFAIHDGPGIRTTVFLKGCPLSCWWCHNPESQSASPDLLYRPQLCARCGTCVEACPEGLRSLTGDVVERDSSLCVLCGTCVEACPAGAVEMVGRLTNAEDLMAKIERDTSFFDESGGGVTFSGGEPLEQAAFLTEVLDRCGEHEIHTAVDTCGFARPDLLQGVAERTDLFLFDLKCMDTERHIELTGVGNDLILANLRMLDRMGKQIHIRVPVIPTVTDGRDNLEALGEFAASLESRPGITLLPHHPTAMEKYSRFSVDKQLPDGVEAPSRESLEKIAFGLERFGLEVTY